MLIDYLKSIAVQSKRCGSVTKFYQVPLDLYVYKEYFIIIEIIIQEL